MRPASSSSCKGLRPSSQAFLLFGRKKTFFYFGQNFGNFCWSVDFFYNLFFNQNFFLITYFGKKKFYLFSFPILGIRNSTIALQSSQFQNAGGSLERDTQSPDEGLKSLCLILDILKLWKLQDQRKTCMLYEFYI